MPELLSGDRNNEGFHAGDNAPDDDGPSDVPGPLDLVCHMLMRYLHLTPHQYVALALWIIHTHVFDRFTVTPRLALRSPRSRLRQNHHAVGSQRACSQTQKGRSHHGGCDLSNGRR